MEDGFKEFSAHELDVGYEYAQSECSCRVDYGALRIIGNQAGAILKARGCGANTAAQEALFAYMRRNGIRSMQALKQRAYIRSVAKMLGERSPRRAAKRAREEHIAEIKAAG